MKKEKKQTFTYSILPSVRNRAIKKADKAGDSLSGVIERLLDRYAPDVRKQKAMEKFRWLAQDAGMSQSDFDSFANKK